MSRALALSIALAGAACSGDKKSPSPEPATGDPAPVETAPADKPPADEPADKPPATKAFPIDSLGTALVIELPEGFAAGEATGDYARFAGPDFKILVEIPAEGASLRDERDFVKTPKATAFIDETFDGGEAIAYRAGDTVAAVVAFGKLGILCSGADLDSEDEAKAAIAACRTLRAR